MLKLIVPACTVCFVLLPTGVLRADDPSARDDTTRASDLSLDLAYRSVYLGAFQDDSQDAAPTQTPATGDASATPADLAPPETIWTRKQLTGDWWDFRTTMADHGVTLDLRLSQYYQGVVSGGVNQNGEYGGTMDYRLNVDAGKLFGAKGLAFNMHARTRFGRDINADAGALVLPNAGLLMPAPGNYHGTDITGLTVSYTFPLFEGHLGNVTVGKLDVIDLVTGFFPNIGYGQEGFWNVNSMVSALPWFGSVQGLSLYGGMAVTISEKYETIESGFIFAGTENVSTSWGSLSDSFSDGVFLAGFHRFLWDLDDKMGYFMVFGGGSTKAQASNDPHDFIVIPGQGIMSTEQHKPWDIALYLYQDFWQAEGDPNRKANFMIGGTVGPDNPQFAQWNFFANVEAFGSMESRPHDRMGVAGYWNGLSGNFTDLVSPVVDLRRDLWGFELYYNFEVTPWFHVTPDLQIAQNENSGDDTAVILGVSAVLDF